MNVLFFLFLIFIFFTTRIPMHAAMPVAPIQASPVPALPMPAAPSQLSPMPMTALPMPAVAKPALPMPAAPAVLTPMPMPAPMQGPAAPTPLSPMQMPPMPMPAVAKPMVQMPALPQAQFGAALPNLQFGGGDGFGDDQGFDDFQDQGEFPGQGLNFPGQALPFQAPVQQGIIQGQIPGHVQGQMPQAPGMIFPVAQNDFVKAMDSVALQAFPEGTRVVFLFVGQGEKNSRLLKVTRGIYVAPTGKDPFDPKCQFVVLRKGNWIGFKSDFLQGKTLQSDPKNYVVHCPNNNFSADTDQGSHWSAQFVNPQDVSSVVSFQNRLTQGFLSFPYEPWAENLAWTALKERTAAMIAGERSFFKIVKVSDLPKNVSAMIGGKEFLYTSRLHKKLTPLYCEDWKFKEPGKGTIQFDADSKEKIIIGISTVAENLSDQMYYLVIGDQNGKCSTIRKQIDGPIFHKEVLKQPFEKKVVQESQNKDDKFISYWIEVNSGKISYGIGSVIGQDKILEWNDPGTPLNVQYVGFSGDKSRVVYKNILLDGKGDLQSSVVIPREFTKESGSLKSVAVGCYEDDIEIWGIGLDNKLWRWKNGSMAKNPWEIQKIIIQKDREISEPVEAISISSVGDIFIICNGKVYKLLREKSRWTEVDSGLQSIEMTSISGHLNNLWAIGKDGVAYQYSVKSKSWEKRSDSESSQKVVVSPDNEVFVLNKVQALFQYKGNRRWNKISASKLFIDFFVINKELVFGIDNKNDLWQYTPSKKWARVAGQNHHRASGFVSGSGNVLGMIVLLDQLGNIYKRVDQGIDKNISVSQIKKMIEQRAPAYKNEKKQIKIRKVRKKIRTSWKKLKRKMKNNVKKIDKD